MTFAPPLHLAAAAALMAVYFVTLYPSIPGGDAGEVVAEACRFGVAHPPGYPLFVILYGVWMRIIPFGVPAWRSNLLSAIFTVFGALAAGRAASLASASMLRAVYSATSPQLKSATTTASTASGRVEARISWIADGAGALTMLLMGFSLEIWTYAVGAEVFALNNFFVGMYLLMFAEFTLNPTHRKLYLGALLSGLALTNQHTMLLFVAPGTLWVLWHGRHLLTPTSVLLSGIMGLLGLSPYIHLWITDRFRPQANSWGDSSTLAGFWRHFTRADYGSFRLMASDNPGTPFWPKTVIFWKDFNEHQGLYIALPLLCIAVGVSLWLTYHTLTAKRRKSTESPPVAHVGIGLVLLYAFYLAVFHSLSNTDVDEPGIFFEVHARFWMQPNIAGFVIAGVGAALVVGLAARSTIVGQKRHTDRSHHRSPSKEPRAEAKSSDEPQDKRRTRADRHGPVWLRLLCVAGPLLAGGLQCMAHWEECDMSENEMVVAMQRAAMESLPHGAMAVSVDDVLWTAGQYLRICENYRTDLHYLSQPVMCYDWWGNQLRDLHLHDELPLPTKGRHLMFHNSTKRVRGETFSMYDVMHSALAQGVPLYVRGSLKPDNWDKDLVVNEEFTFVPHGAWERVYRAPAPSGPDRKMAEVVKFHLDEQRAFLAFNQTFWPQIKPWDHGNRSLIQPNIVSRVARVGTWENQMTLNYWLQLSNHVRWYTAAVATMMPMNKTGVAPVMHGSMTLVHTYCRWAVLHEPYFYWIRDIAWHAFVTAYQLVSETVLPPGYLLKEDRWKAIPWKKAKYSTHTEWLLAGYEFTVEVGSRWLEFRAPVDDVRTKEAGPVLRYSQGQVKRLTAKLEADAAPKVSASIEADHDAASKEPDTDATDTAVDVGMVQAPESHEGSKAVEQLNEAEAVASPPDSSKAGDGAAMHEVEVDPSTGGELAEGVETDSQAQRPTLDAALASVWNKDRFESEKAWRCAGFEHIAAIFAHLPHGDEAGAASAQAYVEAKLLECRSNTTCERAK